MQEVEIVIHEYLCRVSFRAPRGFILEHEPEVFRYILQFEAHPSYLLPCLLHQGLRFLAVAFSKFEPCHREQGVVQRKDGPGALKIVLADGEVLHHLGGALSGTKFVFGQQPEGDTPSRETWLFQEELQLFFVFPTLGYGLETGVCTGRPQVHSRG